MNWPFNIYAAYVANCTERGVIPEPIEWWTAACQPRHKPHPKSPTQADADDFAIEMGDQAL